MNRRSSSHARTQAQRYETVETRRGSRGDTVPQAFERRQDLVQCGLRGVRHGCLVVAGHADTVVVGVDFSASTRSIGGLFMALKSRVSDRSGARARGAPGRLPQRRIARRNAGLCYGAERETRARLRVGVRVRGLVRPGTCRVAGGERAPLLRFARRPRRTTAALQPRERARDARSRHDERSARRPVCAPRVRGPHHVRPAHARAAPRAGVPLGASADGLTYTFHLRPGLAWADGTPLTSRDFLWSWLRVLRPRPRRATRACSTPSAAPKTYNKGHA
jgi:hypothetical protein